MAYYKLSDFSMYYECHGSGSEIWVWIHGNIASTRWWQHVLPLLPEQVRLVTMDLRGCGQSERTEHGYQIRQFAEDVYALTQYLNLTKFHLLGHSMGGQTALALSLTHPEIVESLTLLDSVPADGLVLDDERRQGFRELVKNQAALEQAVRLCLPYCQDEQFIQAVFADAVDCAQQIYTENPETMHQTCLVEQLDQIRCPVLILHGREDQIIPVSAMEATIDRLKHARVVLLERCGHSPFNERPQEAFQIFRQFIS